MRNFNNIDNNQPATSRQKYNCSLTLYFIGLKGKHWQVQDKKYAMAGIRKTKLFQNLNHGQASAIFALSKPNPSGDGYVYTVDNHEIFDEVQGYILGELKKEADKLNADTRPASKPKKVKRGLSAVVTPKLKATPAAKVKVRDNEDLANACADLGVTEKEFLKLLALAGKSA